VTSSPLLLAIVRYYDGKNEEERSKMQPHFDDLIKLLLCDEGRDAKFYSDLIFTIGKYEKLTTNDFLKTMHRF
jgi:hypothetical protein